jgi:hypothetical protein
MSMAWDEVSELRPPTGLSLIPYMTWEWRDTVELYWQGERKNSEKNLSQSQFVQHKSHTELPGHNPGLRGAIPVTKRLIHGTVLI